MKISENQRKSIFFCVAKLWHNCDIFEKPKHGESLAQSPARAFIQAPRRIVVDLGVKPICYQCGQVKMPSRPSQGIWRLTVNGVNGHYGQD